MDNKRYLFVSYMLANGRNTKIGDICFEFYKAKKVTMKEIREYIISKCEESGFDTGNAVPAIVGMQVLDEDIATMLYEL